MNMLGFLMLEDTYVKALSVILLKTLPSVNSKYVPLSHFLKYTLSSYFCLYMTVNTGIHFPKVLFSHWETQPFIVHFLLYVVKFESCNNLSLLDNNECGSQPSLCGAKGICQNTPGSFSCECQRGFSLDATGLNCEGEFICSKTLNHIQHAVFFFLPSH